MPKKLQEELDPLSSEAMCIKHNIKGKKKKNQPSPTPPPQNQKESWVVHFEGQEDGPEESDSKPQSPPRTSSSDNDSTDLPHDYTIHPLNRVYVSSNTEGTDMLRISHQHTMQELTTRIVQFHHLNYHPNL
jgi:hypothetical protein